jgi:hemerythrin
MFEWKPEYSVQLPEIDAQHRRLFALAAELHTAMSQGQGKTVLEKALAQLADYTKAHFAAEERLMRKYEYPLAHAHKLQHDQLTAQVLDLQQRFCNGEGVVTVDLMLFLQDWLSTHILGSDMKYSPFIRAKTAA